MYANEYIIDNVFVRIHSPYVYSIEYSAHDSQKCQ